MPGSAEGVQHQGHLGPGNYLAITPVVSWSWGIEEPRTGADKGGPKKILWASLKTVSGESQ
jgi:hypothetical protein